MKKILTGMMLAMLVTQASAQPFSLRSTEGNAFSLTIYCSPDGKGAFVQYHSNEGIIPLRIKSVVKHNNGQDDGLFKITYVWDEIVGGKVNGSYGLTQEPDKISGAWYKRKKDGKQFQLEKADQTDNAKGLNKYLLHNILISFYQTSNEQLTFKYGTSNTQPIQLPVFDHPDQLRRGFIADYNFDGYDDVAFSIPDAGMGVYQTFSIFLYDSRLKACDVTLDSKNKLLLTSCRGAANWWKDVYRFSKGNKLVWVNSGKTK
jgi:hypothetical protein